MRRAQTIFPFVAGFALGAWALLGISDTAKTAEPSANAPAAQPATPAPASPAAGGQGATSGAAGPGATQPQAGQSQAGGAGQTAAGGGGNPQDMAKSAEKGSLKSPYQDFKKVAEEGHQKFMSAGCNGCHGGTGGGGMGPPLTNPIWVYGSDDDTLFRLISLGSD
jgi:mono/diheme cytochrome c family protein